MERRNVEDERSQRGASQIMPEMATGDGATWRCISELVCGNGGDARLVKAGRASTLGRHYCLSPNGHHLGAKLSQRGPGNRCDPYKLG